MKTKILVLIGVMVIVFSCKKSDITREVPGNTSKTIPGDVVLELSKENEARARKKPLPPNNPHNPTDTVTPPPPPPPPPTTGRGCFLIDFNGHNVTGIWGEFYCTPSNLDASKQLSVLNRVISDYSFDASIVVTTDEAVYNTYPQNKRRRCVVTTNNFYGNVGGVAYIGSFNWYDESPCFVFSSLLGDNAKFVSDATSHEFGHTVGLYHAVDDTHFPDGSCVKNSEYLVGDLIMGSSYYSSSPRFDVVEIACGATQDEKQVTTNTINQ